MAKPYDIEADGSIVLSVYVQPSASRAGVVGRHGDALKVKVAAPPDAGQANVAVARLLAAELGLRRGDVELLQGATSRSKRVRLRNVDRVAFDQWLDGFAG